MKVYEFLDSPDKWTKHEYARDKDGKRVRWDSDLAKCWCLRGAITKCYFGNYAAAQQANTKILHRISLPCEDSPISDNVYIEIYNDDPKTTYEDIIKICKELDV